jgi:hypothetical protein
MLVAANDVLESLCVYAHTCNIIVHILLWTFFSPIDDVIEKIIDVLLLRRRWFILEETFGDDITW